MALKNLLVRIGADLSGLSRGVQEAQGKLNKFSQTASSALGTIGKTAAIAGAAITAGLALAPAIRDAMEYETSLNQVNRMLGQSSDEFMKWSESTASAFGYSRLEAVKTGATFSTLLSTFSTSAEDNANKTMELMKATAIASSATGRTMEDTFERVRSGLLGNTEAVEDLGVSVMNSTIEQTNAYRQMSNGVRFESLTESVKQQIRYMAILEQVYAKYGTTIADSTSMRMAYFVQSLNNVKLALGQAFLPILNVVLPVLTTFMNKVASAMGVVAQFFRALVGKKGDIPAATKAYNYQAAAVGNLGAAQLQQGKDAKKAAKDQAKANGVAGFDQVHTMPSDSGGADAGGGDGGGGAGGGGIGDIGSGLEGVGEGGESAFAKISKEVEEFAKKVKKFFSPAIEFIQKQWERLTKYITKKIKELTKFWEEHGEQVIKAFNNVWKFIKPIIKFIYEYVVNSLEGMVDGAIKILLGIVKFLTGIFTKDWKLAFEGIKDIVFGAVELIWNFLNLTLLGGIKKILFNIGEGFAKTFAKAVTDIKAPFSKIETWFGDIGTKMWTYIKKPFETVGTWFKTNVIDKMGASLSEGVSSLGTKASAIWEKIKSPFTTTYTWFRDNVASKISTALSDNTSSIGSKAGEVWTAIKGKFSDVYGWFKTNVGDRIRSALSGISDTVTDGLTGAFKAVFNKAAGAINYMIELLNKAAAGINKAIIGSNPVPTISYRVPYLATGGVVTKATQAVIGEDGAEAVMPLEKNTGWIGNLAGQIAQKGGAGGSGDITLNIDGKTFARILKPYLDSESSRIGQSMKIRTT